jgi:Mg/Co/Ni transporter MgtE
MINSLFLAQMLQTMGDLKTAIGRGLAIGVVFSFIYFCFMMWRGLTMDRASGEWKFEIAKGIAVFATVTVANVLFAVFYPGQSITVNFT